MSGNISQPLPGREPGVPGPAAPRAARPQLRIVDGGLDDAVVRRKRFEEAHPEIVIISPKTQVSIWTARRDGRTLASGYHLGALLDSLDWLLGKQP
ncbi:MAG: hypothetical protein ABSA53_15420 [Streptosporangiaceae bacterium]|jgi:hypothetical protein